MLGLERNFLMNIMKDEQAAMDELSNDNNILIGPADKDSGNIN